MLPLSRLARRCAAAAGLVGVTLVGGISSLTHAAAAPETARRTVHRANLMSAITGLPGYYPGFVHWHLTTDRHYGTTNWQTNTITISMFTPLDLLYSVVAHEWSHEVQAFDYHPDQVEMVKQLNAHFGGPGPSGYRGVEFSADCMALALGATWTHYTHCDDTQWRRDARLLLAGTTLPVPADAARD